MRGTYSVVEVAEHFKRLSGWNRIVCSACDDSHASAGLFIHVGPRSCAGVFAAFADWSSFWEEIRWSLVCTSAYTVLVDGEIVRRGRLRCVWNPVEERVSSWYVSERVVNPCLDWLPLLFQMHPSKRRAGRIEYVVRSLGIFAGKKISSFTDHANEVYIEVL